MISLLIHGASDIMMKVNDAKLALLKNSRGEALRSALLGAWGELEANYPDRAWWRRKGTRAAIVWELAVKRAIEALASDAAVVSHNDTVSLIFDDRLLVRFKKADMELRSRNYPTMAAQLFHEPEADLFGFEGLQRVEVVYVLNQFETKIDWIGIVARNGGEVAWHFELESADAAVSMFPVEVPALEEPAESAAGLATLKRGKSTKDDTSGTEGK